MHESTVRRRAKSAGYLLRRSRRRDRTADDFGLYVLVDDTAGNQWRHAQAPISAFARGEGDTLAGVVEQLKAIGF